MNTDVKTNSAAAARRDAPLILLVDDSMAEQRLLVEVLTGQKFRLAIALNGMDGFQKALLNNPDLILLDVSMPGVDGFGVCRMLKANALTKHIPVIFLTSGNEPKQRLDGLLLGAVDYIPKPFSTELEVLARIRLHLPWVKEANAPLLRGTHKRMPTALGVSSQALLANLAVEYLTSDLANAPTPAELARMVGTNETTLNEAFRKEFDLPVFAFLREERLRHAQRLLAETKISIGLIGEHVGYVHSGNFTTAFRQRFGITPREFRQRSESGQTIEMAQHSAPVQE